MGNLRSCKFCGRILCYESCQNPLMIRELVREVSPIPPTGVPINVLLGSATRAGTTGDLTEERAPVVNARSDKLEKLLRAVLHLNGGGGMRLLGYIEHWAATGNEDAQEVATQLHEVLGENLEPVEDVPS